MQPPPVRYVTTRDGKNIAHTVAGTGLPVILMPFPFNHVRLNWDNARRRSWFEGLSRHFRLVHYDSRGQGLSGRGLGEGHCMADYGRDVEAIVAHLGLDQFLFLGCNYFGHVAIRYAVDHPALVRGLILTACAVSMASWPAALENLADQNWDSSGTCRPSSTRCGYCFRPAPH